MPLALQPSVASNMLSCIQLLWSAAPRALVERMGLNWLGQQILCILALSYDLVFVSPNAS